MEKLSFVIWIILWPIMCGAEMYIWILIRNKLGFKHLTEAEVNKVAGFEFMLWIVIALLLFFTGK